MLNVTATNAQLVLLLYSVLLVFKDKYYKEVFAKIPAKMDSIMISQLANSVHWDARPVKPMQFV